MLFFKLKYWIRILWLSSKRFYSGNYSYQAAALTYVTLMSLVPILSVIVYFVGFFPIFTHFINTAQKYIYANLIPSASEVIISYLNQFIAQATKLPVTSILFSFITAIMMIWMIETILNEIWKNKAIHPYGRSQVLGWFVILCMPLLIGFTSSVSEFIYSYAWINQYQSILIILFNLLINTMIFSIIYWVVLNKKIDWSLSVLGGFIAAILFEISKKIFVFYLFYFTSYEVIYGALSIVPIFLIWLYFAWCIFLFGAIIIYVKDSLPEKRFKKKIIP